MMQNCPSDRPESVHLAGRAASKLTESRRLGHVLGQGVSSSSQLPDGWFGSRESKPAALNLVEGSPAVPCEARPFPFWLAGVIATLVLVLGSVGLRLWILPIILVEPEFDAPTIDVRSVSLEEKSAEEPPPAARSRVRGVPPVAPRVHVPMPVPAVQPQVVQAPLIPPRVEPYDPSEILEESELPFPVPEPEKVAETPPKPAPSGRVERSSKPRTTPRPKVAEETSRPVRVLRRYDPAYPRSARQAGAEGRVMLDVQVKSDGRVGSVRVLATSGNRALDSTAIAAVKRWSFSAAEKGGKPVTSNVRVPFRFSLK